MYELGEPNEMGEYNILFKPMITKIPDVFEYMYAILMTHNPTFKKCEEEASMFCDGYLTHDNYYFVTNKHKTICTDIIFLAKENNKNKYKPKYNTLTIPRLSDHTIIKVIVQPLMCIICNKSYVKKTKSSKGITYTCLECNKRIAKSLEDYKKRQELDEMGYYQEWNRHLCDLCESFGHECKECRGYNREEERDRNGW